MSDRSINPVSSDSHASDDQSLTDSPPVEKTTSEKMTSTNHLPDEQLTSSDKAVQVESWASVPLPGTLDSARDASPETVAADAATSDVLDTDKQPLTAEREQELLTLIHDLNECNDVLLSRVSELETSLEKAEAAQRTEAQRSEAMQAKMTQQVSAEQAATQQVSQTAQHQVGKLVSQLESSEQALQRQQLINETLQAEITNYQDRIVQLEKECALSNQQYAEQAQARVKAETTARDLRSRLQRQQRYTLQFKAALEKSLTVSARPAMSTPTSAAANTIAQPQPVSFSGNAVSMPKAQQIMPWAAAANTTPFEGIDPHLEALIRGTGQPAPTSDEPSIPGSNNPPDPAAEDRLWQDLERVMNSSTSEASQQQLNTEQDTQTQRDNNLNKPVESAQETESSTDDSINTASLPEATPLEERAQATAHSTVHSTDTEPAIETSAVEIVNETSANIKPAIAPFAVAEEPPATYTEPSPWGPPRSKSKTALPETGPEREANTQSQTDGKLQQIVEATKADAEADYLPAVDSTAASVSPVANPLKPQKKIRSLAAVNLPTFESAKAGSFKR